MKRSRIKLEEAEKPASPASEAGSKRRKNEHFAVRELSISDGYAAHAFSLSNHLGIWQ